MDYRKKIVYQSNYWYNDGLRKAQIRDMSGAIASLRSSLQFSGMDHQQEPAPAGQYRELLY